MTIRKSINTEKSHAELIKYLHTLDFFNDFIKIINPIKYDILTHADIENNSVTWPVRVVYEDNPNMPIINSLIPKLNIEQIWNYQDHKIYVKIKSSFMGSSLFEMDFKCQIMYLGDIEVEADWVYRSYFIPNMVLDIVLEQFEDILKKILN